MIELWNTLSKERGNIIYAHVKRLVVDKIWRRRLLLFYRFLSKCVIKFYQNKPFHPSLKSWIIISGTVYYLFFSLFYISIDGTCQFLTALALKLADFVYFLPSKTPFLVLVLSQNIVVLVIQIVYTYFETICTHLTQKLLTFLLFLAFLYKFVLI